MLSVAETEWKSEVVKLPACSQKPIADSQLLDAKYAPKVTCKRLNQQNNVWIKFFIFHTIYLKSTPAPSKRGIYVPKPKADSQKPTPAPSKRGIYLQFVLWRVYKKAS